MAQPGDVAGSGKPARGQPCQGGARFGYAVSGVLHLLIDWIALQVAWSGSRRSADESGALGRQPVGPWLLTAVASASPPSPCTALCPQGMHV